MSESRAERDAFLAEVERLRSLPGSIDPKTGQWIPKPEFPPARWEIDGGFNPRVLPPGVVPKGAERY